MEPTDQHYGIGKGTGNYLAEQQDGSPIPRRGSRNDEPYQQQGGPQSTGDPYQ
jgi:hypothetical protein